MSFEDIKICLSTNLFSLTLKRFQFLYQIVHAYENEGQNLKIAPKEPVNKFAFNKHVDRFLKLFSK